jgi:hypothetical protein
MQQLVQQHLARARRKMKFQADKKRSHRTFQVGDSVYVKIQPYVQTTLASRSSNKLAFRYFGPYPIEAKINEVAYQLKLPKDSKIHPIFHVSLLKKAVSPHTIVHSALPDPALHYQVPQLILDRRLHLHNNSAVSQVLVKWSHLPQELSTWEDETALRQDFPRAPAWGQAVPCRGRDVTNTKTAKTVDQVITTSEPDAIQEEANGGDQVTMRSRQPSSRVFGPDWVNS